MKKTELKPEYTKEELGKGVRCKYFQAYQDTHNLVLLNPEVAKAFPTDEAVNKALLSLIKIAKASVSIAETQ